MQVLNVFNSLLNFPMISRIRRNHALEHATLTILAEKDGHLSAAGYSDMRGFIIMGNVSTDQLHAAVNEAIDRLSAGEASLAIHPHCGTNFVAQGIVAGALAWLAMLGTGANVAKKLERLPSVMLLATIGMIAAQPLGPRLQAALTTDPDIGELEVTEIARLERQGTPIHRIRTVN
jgi:hypothetical protein